jgi:hypothetical protein
MANTNIANDPSPRVQVLSEKVLFYQPPPEPTLDSFRDSLEQLDALGDDLKNHYLVCNVAGSRVLTAEERALIRDFWAARTDRRPLHIALVTGGNVLLNATVKFILKRTFGDATSVHRTLDSALARIDALLSGES